MQITFKMAFNTQSITLEELNDFQLLTGKLLPEDYRQHMLLYNGGIVNEDVKHINYLDGGEGISYLYPIKYGDYIMEKSYDYMNGRIPAGFLAIGTTDNGGEIIISLNGDGTYGNTKEWFPEGKMYDLSPSFTQLLDDMILDED